MAKEIIYLTAEGYKKLKDELDHMRSVERPAISAAIAEARDKGDLSENAEYDAPARRRVCWRCVLPSWRIRLLMPG